MAVKSIGEFLAKNAHHLEKSPRRGSVPAEPAAASPAQPPAYVPHRYVPRQYRAGNYCGHDPAAPALEITRPATDRRRPKILEVLHENVSRYYHEPRLIPNLRDCCVHRNGRRDRRKHKMRSERREAIVQILRACAHFVDLTTLHLGRHVPAGFAWTTKAQLRKLTSLGAKRFDRALRDLRESKIVRIFERSKRHPFIEGEFRAEPAIKIFSQHLFGAFGLAKWLEAEMERARQRHEQRKAQRAEAEAKKPLSGAAQARGALVLGGLADSLVAGSTRADRRTNQQSKKSQREDILRKRDQMIREFQEANPNLDAASILRTIDDGLRRRGIDIYAIQRQTFPDD